MGNTPKIIYVDEPSFYFVENIDISIGGINLMDFFPMLRDRKAIVGTILNLWLVTQATKYNVDTMNVVRTLRNNFPCGYDQTEILDLSPHTIRQVEKELILSGEIKDAFHLVQNIKETSLSTIDLYSFIFVCNKNGVDNLIKRITSHPKVCPLIVSIVCRDYDLIVKYVRVIDPRRNNISPYRWAKAIETNRVSGNPVVDIIIKQMMNLEREIVAIVRVAILSRILLTNRVFRSISLDIYKYFVEINLRRVFYK